MRARSTTGARAARPSLRPALAPLLLAMALALPAFGESSLGPLTLAAGASVTALRGEARELVYYDDELLSELDWDMNPLVLYGGELELSWREGPRFFLSAGAAFPGNTGIMTDRDWLNLQQDGTDGLTHFSRSDADLLHAYSIRASAGWNFTFPKENGPERRVIFTPSLSFRYMSWEWAGNDGYLQHADDPGSPTVAGSPNTYQLWDPSVTKEYISGTAISYLQEYWLPELVLSLALPLSERFRFGPTLSVSPWVFCNGVDRHYYPVAGTDYEGSDQWKTYYDQLSGGFLFEPGIAGSLRVTDRFTVKISASQLYIGDLRGDTYIQESGDSSVGKVTESSGGGGGAALDALTVSFSAVIRIR